MRTLVQEATTCCDGGCAGNKAHGAHAGECPIKRLPYGPPPRPAPPKKKAVHKRVAAMVAVVRDGIARLEAAVAYEGTSYSEMLGDLGEMERRIARHLADAIAYVRPLQEAAQKAADAQQRRRRVAQGLEAPCEKDGA